MKRLCIYSCLVVCSGPACLGPRCPAAQLQTRRSAAIHTSIRCIVGHLGYEPNVVELLLARLEDWSGVRPSDLEGYASRLEGVRSDQDESVMASQEWTTVGAILRSITIRLVAEADQFSLVGALTTGRHNCLCVTQIFYILGTSVGLHVIPIEVLEFKGPGPLPPGATHVSCMVELADGTTVMLNAMPRYGLSRPFVLDQWFQEGRQVLRLRSKANPLGLYRRFRILDPNGLAACVINSRGVLLASRGSYLQATDCYLAAMNLDPHNPQIYNNLGIAYRHLGLLYKAIECYSKAIEIRPECVEAYCNRAAAHNLLGHPDEAITDCNTAIAICPSFAQAYNNRGNAFARIGRYQEALADYSKSISLAPRLVQAYVNRAIVQAMLGRSQAARQDLAKTARLDPGIRQKVIAVSKRFALDLR
ncbi:MAG: tetratricopeptide repeat protein [Sedimentisphaerales bacterium]|nr:tetratricopeptide repeat protein [Sedimentisphaerales bacterium]